MNPAGGVYIAINDWAFFIQELINGLAGKSTYLKKETYKKVIYTGY